MLYILTASIAGQPPAGALHDLGVASAFPGLRCLELCFYQLVVHLAFVQAVLIRFHAHDYNGAHAVLGEKDGLFAGLRLAGNLREMISEVRYGSDFWHDCHPL